MLQGLRHPLDVLTPAVLPAAGAVAGFALIATELLLRADTLQVPAYDTAFFEQLVWNLGHGRGLASGFFAGNFLGLHFSPLLALPAALELAWPDARLLGLLDAAGLAAAAPAAFLLLRALLAGRPGGDLAAAALAAPLPFWLALQWAGYAGFHTEALALPLVLLAGWAGLRGRPGLCWTCAAVALAAKEDQAYAVAVIGLLLAVHGPSRRQGVALALAGAAWGAAAELVVMPALLGPVPSDLRSYYAWLHHPTAAQVASALATPGGWLGLAAMVAAMAGLPLLRPAWLALVLPPLLGDLLSAHSQQPELRFQYALPMVVPVLVAGGLGARRLLDRARPAAALGAWGGKTARHPVARWSSRAADAEDRSARIPIRKRGPDAAVVRMGRMGAEGPSAYRLRLLALALPALVVGVVFGPLLGQRPPVHQPALDRLLACTSALPPRAPLAVDDAAAAPLAARPVEEPLTYGGRSYWVVVDRTGPQPGYVNLAARARLLAALPDQGRRLLCDDGRFQLWSPAGG